VVSAERPETLNLLVNDSRGLEQALRDAGLRADAGSLSFNLRGGEARQEQASSDRGGRGNGRRGGNAGIEAIDAAASASSAIRQRRHLGALDIRI
jgi:hypothetical protein